MTRRKTDEIPPAFYRKDDLAQMFGVHSETITRYVKAGKLPAPVRLGAHPRWPRPVIDRLLVELTTAAS